MTVKLALAAALLTAGAAAAQEAPSCAPSNLSEVRADFAEEFGAFRKGQGLPVLSTDDMVQTAAQTFACEIAATGRLNHEAPDGARAGVRLWRAGYDWCRVGEILAVGQDDAEFGAGGVEGEPPAPPEPRARPGGGLRARPRLRGQGRLPAVQDHPQGLAGLGADGHPPLPLRAQNQRVRPLLSMSL